MYAKPRVGEVAPETYEGSLRDTTMTTHPAFAQIGAYRVSGHTNLYDSEFKHNGYMAIRISRSELHRGLNYDRHYGREEYIEVALSEAQWATFVSAPNMGSGVPCTLQHINGKQVPGIPDFDRKSQVVNEMEMDFENVLGKLKEALEAVDNLGVSAKKASEVRSKIEAAHREISANMPFTVEQFERHVEQTVERGKAEIHGHMTNVIQRAGLEALGGNLPLSLTNEKEK